MLPPLPAKNQTLNPEVAGSNPAPATMKTRPIDGFFVYRHFSLHSTDRIRMSERKHIEKIDERVDR
jgi:hypothetical protein